MGLHVVVPHEAGSLLQVLFGGALYVASQVLVGPDPDGPGVLPNVHPFNYILGINTLLKLFVIADIAGGKVEDRLFAPLYLTWACYGKVASGAVVLGEGITFGK